jgi:hypothetical protein
MAIAAPWQQVPPPTGGDGGGGVDFSSALNLTPAALNALSGNIAPASPGQQQDTNEFFQSLMEGGIDDVFGTLGWAAGDFSGGDEAGEAEAASVANSFSAGGARDGGGGGGRGGDDLVSAAGAVGSGGV